MRWKLSALATVSSQIAMKDFRLTTSGAARARCIVHDNNNVFADANTRSMREVTWRSAVAFACLSVLAAGIGLAPASADDKISIIMGGGPLWDPFFGAMKKGADDAAKDLGVDYQWVTGTDPNNWMADYAKLLKQSASRHPSALVIGNYFPDSFDPIIFKAAGDTPKLAAVAFSDSFNPTQVTQAIKGLLQADPNIDAIWTLGAAQAIDAVDAIDQLGKAGKVANASLGLSVNALQALHDRKLQLIADMQPYLDGYYGLVAAYQYVKYGMLPAGQVLTGPLMITKDNVDQVLKISKQYPGVRGAS
jgi:ABC-type sugar transport system substrate-binding protein